MPAPPFGCAAQYCATAARTSSLAPASARARYESDEGGCFSASLILSRETGRFVWPGSPGSGFMVRPSSVVLICLSCVADADWPPEDAAASSAEVVGTAKAAVNSRANNG